MSAGVLLQAIINGIMIGGIYALVGMSLNMIFGVMKIVNFCQGELLMVSMYVTYMLYSYCGLDPFIAIPLVAVIMFIIGAVIQVSLITRSIKDDGDQNVLFLTCCLGIFLSNLALLLFKSDYRTVNSMFADQIVQVAGMNISVPKLVGFLILCVTTALIFLMLKKTKLGKQIRATSQNPVGAQVTGIKIKAVYACTYGIGAAIAGIAGACLMSYYYVFPAVGNTYGTRSFIVVTMGGLGSTIGACLGGIALGVMETVGSSVVGSAFKDTLVFLAFILVLVVKENLNIRKKRG
ncbi:branched-chain amino acid ABC transporter permease [Novisyntrophococcus fermenticellae]|uniref:branched-chain amino acid ABC transporter permease n=1 Tax=Novisyntrophococcus fermenticellae TaxID=2068655 RepID=UPI001E60F0D6|nr:branched-chain amino acid ABC transporter permease [Novisyntrophococcus fermenticellae]